MKIMMKNNKRNKMKLNTINNRVLLFWCRIIMKNKKSPQIIGFILKLTFKQSRFALMFTNGCRSYFLFLLNRHNNMFHIELTLNSYQIGIKLVSLRFGTSIDFFW